MRKGTSMGNDATPIPARAQAEDWFARIQGGSCSEEQRLQFRQWLLRPGNREAYARVEALWRRIGDLPASARLQALADEALAQTGRPARRGIALAWAMAAALAALALLPFAQRSWQPEVRASSASTTPGQRTRLNLPDGSRVWLNVDTRLSYRFDAHERRLQLLRGEASFEVAHDAARPFRVLAGSGETVALGTRFQVRRREDQVEVTLLEGSVQVRREYDPAPVRIRPGMQASYRLAADGSGIRVHPVDVEVASAWTRGRLLFRATPLAELLAEVNRYSTRPILLEDASLAAFPISGTFPIGDNPSAALALQAVLPLQADFSRPERITLHPTLR